MSSPETSGHKIRWGDTSIFQTRRGSAMLTDNASPALSVPTDLKVVSDRRQTRPFGAYRACGSIFACGGLCGRRGGGAAKPAPGELEPMSTLYWTCPNEVTRLAPGRPRTSRGLRRNCVYARVAYASQASSARICTPIKEVAPGGRARTAIKSEREIGRRAPGCVRRWRSRERSGWTRPTTQPSRPG
jgi:hypothetical protein